jgi:HAE1 family hydrophobic/amphiphilic exporter-1
MDPIGISIKRPISVAVGVILIILFGIIAIGQIPIQLTPTVDRPTVTIETSWPGRSPQEIVDEITKEQEERLKNVSNLRKMRSTSREGASVIELEFYVGSDLARALQEVSDKLRQVPSYPDEVDEPTVKSAEGSPENAIAWIIIDVDPELAASLGDFDITTLFDRLDREVKPFLERIDGVAEVNIYGGREREVQVLVDPVALAQRSISPIEVVNALNAENRNVSAGTIAEGKRDYRIRVIGQFTRAEDVMSTVIAYRDGKPVYVKDVASVEISHRKARGFVRSLGQPCLAMNVIRQTNANVVEVMEELRLRLEEVRTEILPNLDERVGPAIRMRQVYDETTYIDAAVGLVTGNLWKGGLLAAIVLLLFLRSASATMAVALAIPISVVGTFLVMVGVGRTLNVISLAGLAFATGMVVDNSIVVLENIDRRRRLGDSPFRAAYRGAREVWGAVLASTLTTLVVFIPVLTIKEEAGQLFRDIALAIAAAVALSLVVSLTVIPAWCSRVVRSVEAPKSRLGRMSASAFGLAPIGARVTNAVGGVMRWVISGWRAWTLAPALVVVLTLLAAIGSRALMPPLDYLPAGNRNLVFGGLLIPPGLSIDEQTRIAEVIEGQIKPYSDARSTIPGSVESLPPINRGFGPFVGTTPPFDPVGVDNFFIGAFDGGMFVGATSQDEQVVIPIGQLLTNSMQTIPDAYGGARQTSLFAGGLQGGNTIDLEISGPRLDRVVSAAGMMFGISGQAFGFGNVRANPANFTISQPEWQVRLNRAGRELGLTTRDIGIAVRGLVDGAFIGDFLLDGQAVDMVILPRGGRLDHKEQLAFVPVATPSGRIVPLDSVIDVIPSTAQQEIQRIEELPSVTLQISPEPGQAIETVMQQIREQVIAPAQQAGMIDSSMRVRLEGTAAKLDVVRREMLGSVGEARVGATPGWAKVGLGLLLTIGLGVIGFALLKGVRKYPGSTVAGVLGVSIVFALLGVTFWTVANNPAVGYARLVWALVVTYFVMCALFESFVYPLVIMFSVPLASVGGFLGLRIVHDWTMLDPTMAPQQLDVLTMLGFIILIGTVVNNAILIVENALAALRGNEYGDPPMPLIDAIEYAVKTRLRPIFMTTATTVGGMLPLVISPGSGSEMYRGLGAVVLGGLVVSTIFTLVVVPVLFSLVVRMQDGFRKAIGAPSVAERLRAKIEDPTSTAPVSAT